MTRRSRVANGALTHFRRLDPQDWKYKARSAATWSRKCAGGHSDEGTYKFNDGSTVTAAWCATARAKAEGEAGALARRPAML